MTTLHATLRNRIETGFRSFGFWVSRHRWLALFLMLLMSFGLISQAPKLTMDTSIEGFLHDQDPIRVYYDEFRDQFGRDEVVFLGIPDDNIFSDVFMQKLKALHEDLEANLPYLDEVTSLINVRDTRGEGDTLVVDDLMADWPADAQAFAALEARVLNDPLLPNFLIAEDGKLTAVMITTTPFAAAPGEADVLAGFGDEAAAPDTTTQASPGKPGQRYFTPQQNAEFVAALQKIVDQHRAQGMTIYAAGSPVVTEALKFAMQSDMRKFTVLIVLVIAIVLLVLFRRISGVVLPLLVVILTLASTIGLMGATGGVFKLPTQLMPQFLLAIGVAASVHLLAIFYRNLNLNDGDKARAMADALGHSGLPIAMTSITTSAGLLSFSTSQVAPIADLGLYAGIGVMISLVYTLVLLPALIAIIPIKSRKEKTAKYDQRIDQLLTAMADFAVNKAKAIVAVSMVILVVMLASAFNIGFHHDPLQWMPASWEIRQATELMDEDMKGSGNMEVVIDTGRENGLYEPDVMRRLDALQTALLGVASSGGAVGKTTSLADILKETNQALHENRRDFYTIPDNRDLIAQELLLFENSGSDDMENFVDSQFSKARLTVKIPWMDAGGTTEMVNLVQQHIDEEFAGLEVQSHVTGLSAMMGRTQDAAIKSTQKSYLIAAVVITLFMMLVLSSVKIGLIAMLPNFLPIIIGIGTMAALKIPFDTFTMLVGSIALGLAVDDTIHTFHNFQRYHHESGNVLTATRNTLLTTGRAITVTSIVLALGFYIFMTATMNNLVIFGALTGSTIVLALLADFFLGPALMTLLYKSKEKDAY
jgi:predicted RND superfamily exporter protein